MPSVTGAGARLHYSCVGSGEPLLLITGFAISAEIFAPVLPLYAAHFRCITFDNRGAGRSSTPLVPTSMGELAADSVAVLDAVGVDCAHVYGLSMGGMIAQEIALRFPDRVRGLVLGGTSAGGAFAPRSFTGLADIVLQRVPLVPAHVRRRRLTHALFSAGFRAEHPDLVDEYLQAVGAHRAGALGAWWHLMASASFDRSALLPYIGAPTLVLHGDADALTPVANARLLARRIPDAELRLLTGAGHVYLLEQPERSRELLLEWLRRRSPISRGRKLTPLAAAAERFTRPSGLRAPGARVHGD